MLQDSQLKDVYQIRVIQTTKDPTKRSQNSRTRCQSLSDCSPIKNKSKKGKIIDLPKLQINPNIQRNLQFMIKRCYEERIYKFLDGQLKKEHNSEKLLEALHENQKLLKEQFNAIQSIDQDEKYKVLNSENIVKAKLTYLSKLYQEKLSDCQERVPGNGIENSLELACTGFHSDSPQLKCFKRILQNKGMIFSNDNQFEQKLVSDISIKFIKNKDRSQRTGHSQKIDMHQSTTEQADAEYSKREGTGQTLDVQKIRSKSYNTQKSSIQKQNSRIIDQLPMARKTISTAESVTLQTKKCIKTSESIDDNFQKYKFRQTFVKKLPTFAVDIDVEDPNIFKLFLNISQKKFTLYQQLEISRQQLEKYLNKIFQWEYLVTRALNFLSIHQTISFQEYKDLLINFNSWSQESMIKLDKLQLDILFFIFHIFDTQKKGFLQQGDLINLLKYNQCLEDDGRQLLTYHQFPQRSDILFEKCSKLFQQPELTFTLYRSYTQSDQVRKRIPQERKTRKKQTFSLIDGEDQEVTKIQLKDIQRIKTLNSPVKELYEDTKMLNISFSQFCQVFAETIPITFLTFVQALSLKKINSNRSDFDSAYYIQLSSDL